MHASPSLGRSGAVAAFDVGGTDLKTAVVDASGAVVDLRRAATRRDDGDPAGAVIAQLAEDFARLRVEHADLGIGAVGVVVPGHVDDERGVGVYSGNLGWRDVPFGVLLRERLGVPVAFGHDVRAAGRAEFELGAARGFRDVVVLALGTGIAGAVILDGRLHSGGGLAGELGHTLAVADGEPCVCGARGCLETIASASAVARRYTERSGVEAAGAREVLAAAERGDPIARAVWGEAVESLAEHVARLAAVLAPEAVVVGGGLAQAGDALLAPLRSRVESLLSFQRRPQVLPASLGEDAGVLGAALMARSEAFA